MMMIPEMCPAEAQDLIRAALSDMFDEKELLEEPPPAAGFEALSELIGSEMQSLGRRVEALQEELRRHNYVSSTTGAQWSSAAGTQGVAPTLLPACLQSDT
ncbi:unnamed protein product [Amoebophrya sp. A120]|nr:unnamed protein product [Amoebophrya sp. A120]|eukprot:GSA120T00015032001.1